MAGRPPEIEGFPRFVRVFSRLVFEYRGCDGLISGGKMNKPQLTLKARLNNRIHAGRRPMPMPYDQSLYDLDGACPACDHPFGHSNHVCIGAVTRVAI
jgi:hypothetical protein